MEPTEAAGDRARRPTADVELADVDVLVVGAGITGIYQLYRAREAGFSVQLLEAGDGVGRHVVLEPLPRRPVRLGELHLRLPVLAGAVRRVGVAASTSPPSPRPSATSTTWSTASTSAATSGSAPRSPSAEFDEPTGTWPVTHRRRHRGAGPVPRRRHRRALGALPPRRARAATTSAACSTTPGAGRPSRSTSPASGSRSSAPRRAACRSSPAIARRGRVAHRVPAHRQLVHPAQQPPITAEEQAAAPGRTSSAARGAEHVGQRLPPPGEHAVPPSTTRPRSGGRSSSRCGTAPAS